MKSLALSGSAFVSTTTLASRAIIGFGVKNRPQFVCAKFGKKGPQNWGEIMKERPYAPQT
jgi:hypothetical protein